MLNSLLKRMVIPKTRNFAGHSGYSPNYPMGMYFYVDPWHKRIGTGLCTMMWLWIFWRAKNDGKALLGLEHPWDHGHHDSHHGHYDFKFEKTKVGQPAQLVEEE